MTTSPAQNLKKIVARARDLPPVTYLVAIPGHLAIQLSFLAIEHGVPVEEEIVSALDDHTYWLKYEG